MQLERIVLVTALLFALPAASATTGNSLITESIVSSGDSTLAGHLGTFTTGDLRTQTAGAPFGSFQLRAESVKVEIDWEERAVRAGATIRTAEEFGTDSSGFESAVIRSTQARESSFTFVVAMANSSPPEVVAQYEDSATRASQDSMVDHYERVRTDRQPFESPVRNTAATASRSSYAVNITGDFIFSLWDVDFTIEATGGDAQMWTGERSGDLGPAPGTMAADSVRMQQAYLFVTNGTLEMQMMRPHGSVLYVVPEHLGSEGPTTLRAATGTIQTDAGRRDVLGEDIRIEGPAQFDLGRPTAQGVPARIAEATGASIGDEALVLSTAAAPPSDAPLLPWLLMALAALPIALWLRPLGSLRQASTLGLAPPEEPTGLRGRRAAGHWFLAYRASHHVLPNRYHRALATYHAWRAHRIARRPIYTMGYVEALRLDRRWQALLRVAPDLVEQLDDERERAAVALWLHEACDRLGRSKDAVDWRRRAIAENPHAAFEFLGPWAPDITPQDVAFT